MTERYLADLSIDQMSKPKHFKSESGGRDRFGNRFLISRDLAYLDRKGDSVRAGVLISSDGERFIKNNPGIMRYIEKALHRLELSNGSEVNLEDNGRNLISYNQGGQSNVYLLTVGEQKFIIKTRIKGKGEEDRLDQPYINEMLQTQSLAVDLKDSLEDLQVAMPTFLFASGQISCVKFEENEKNYKALDLDKLRELKTKVLEYIIDKRIQDDELWEGVEIDLPVDSIKLCVTAVNNFVTKKDGTIVWIDPFKYNKGWTK